jgi:CBS-domain-containing membrane protein
MVLTVVETSERVARLLPTLKEMVEGGLILVQEVDIYQYSSRFKEILPDIPVHAVMTTPVVTVSPDTLVAEAVLVLLQHVFTALPVVDAHQHVLSIVHEIDLLQRGAKTPVPAGLPRAMEPAERAALLAQLGWWASSAALICCVASAPATCRTRGHNDYS